MNWKANHDEEDGRAEIADAIESLWTAALNFFRGGRYALAEECERHARELKEANERDLTRKKKVATG